MKILLSLTAFLFINVSILYAQTDFEIGSVYLSRAEKSFLDKEIEQAHDYFEKAISYLKVVNESRVARIGALLSYDIKDYTKAKILAKRYFDLEYNKTSDNYFEMLELYVSIEEALNQKDKVEEESRIAIEKEQLENKKLEEEKEREALELVKIKQRSDSLTNVWQEKEKGFHIKMDSIGAFNKDNVAIYKSSSYLGLIDDYGNVLVKAQEYRHVLKHDGFVLFINDIDRPSQIFCYNIETKESYELPNISDHNAQAFDYGKIMLPRANGLLVTYPKNCNDIVIFDLKSRKFVTTKNKISLLKTLKKNKIINKYDKDLRVKLEKQWYSLGTSIGGDFHPLFTEQNKLYGFLSIADGNVYPSTIYNFLGAFYESNFQVIEKGGAFWVDNKGIRQSVISNRNNDYSGTARFEKSEKGTYQVFHEKEGRDIMVLGDETLVPLVEFLKNEMK